MELSENSVWILPALDLNLCLQMLDVGGRTVIPVEKTGIPLNQRMLNSFLYLVELGLVEPAEQAFRPTARMRARLGPVARPSRILRLESERAVVAAAYFGEEAVTLVETTGEDGQSCRISSFDCNKLAQELERLIGSWGSKKTTLEGFLPDGTFLVRKQLTDSAEQRQEDIRAAMAVLTG